MTDNKHLPAYPTPCTMNENVVFTTHAANEGYDLIGLTKRELIAAMCLQGLLANQYPVEGYTTEHFVDTARELADALLNHLQNTEK